MIKHLLKLIKTSPINSREELLEVCSTVALTQLKRDTLSLQRDAEMQAIKDKYDSEIEKQNTKEDHDVRRIKDWAVKHREAEFTTQTFMIGGHELHFQKSPGAVECLGKEADVVDAIVNADGPAVEELQELLLSLKPSLNKTAVLREWRKNGRVLPEIIAMFGLGVSENETFTFTPARTELPNIAIKRDVEREAA